MYPELSDEQIAYVIAALREFIEHRHFSVPVDFTVSEALAL
jgi:hypothetical protein